MIEHIFRNINDIRVFDIMVEFVLGEEEEKKEVNELNLKETNIIDFDGIMDMLSYKDYKRIEVEDSLDHLVRQKILGIKKVKTEGSTGCKICKYAEKLKIPRMGEHKKHIPEEKSIGYIDNYYMITNGITNGLRSAAFAHIFLSIEDEIDEIDEIDINKEDVDIKDVDKDIIKIDLNKINLNKTEGNDLGQNKL